MLHHLLVIAAGGLFQCCIETMHPWFLVQDEELEGNDPDLSGGCGDDHNHNYP